MKSGAFCDEYKGHGVDCTLVYIDPTMKDEAAPKHAREYGPGDYPKVVGRERELVNATVATVTPDVVMVGPENGLFTADGSTITTRI